MATTDDNPPEHLTARVRLSILGQTVQAEYVLPAGPVRPVEMLPLFRSLADVLVKVAVKAAAEEGLSISCRKGCAACCRKPVPISMIEARRIEEVVNELQEPRRRAVCARFAAARQRLLETGLYDKLLRLDQLTDEEFLVVGMEYFRHWIACPFLEQEACLIYPERPLACLEYAVTSPPENCFPGSPAQTVRSLNLPCRLSTALAGIGDSPGLKGAGWLALALVLGWVEGRTDDEPAREAVEILREVLTRLGPTNAL